MATTSGQTGKLMDATLRTSFWKQFGASIDMLDDALTLCPDQLWTAALWDDPEDERYGQFWFVAYHALFWLDNYLTGGSEDFLPPAPFIRGALPVTPYAKVEVQEYLRACRQRCQAAIDALTDERAREIVAMGPPYLELQLYNMRHIQEHAAQLQLLLGQHGVSGPDWVSKARE